MPLTSIPVPAAAKIWYPTHCPVVLLYLRSERSPNPIMHRTQAIMLAGTYLLDKCIIILEELLIKFRARKRFPYPELNANGAMINDVGNISIPDLMGVSSLLAWKYTGP